jgi:hypothetical protein
MYQRLQNFQQRGRLVDDYNEEFYEFLLRSEEQKAHYIGGLRTSLQVEFDQQHICNISQAYQHAKAAKIQQGRSPNRATYKQFSSGHMVASRGQS